MVRKARAPDTTGTWHVMARGNRGQFIFERPADNRYFLKLLGETLQLFGWQCLAFCLMSNHYHLLIRTASPNLSGGMRFLNGRFAQYSNHVHERYGHLFHDRFKSELVDTDDYLATLIRYITLNPVRAEISTHPGEWPWSSWHGMCGARDQNADWFDPEPVLSLFGVRADVSALIFKRFVLSNLDERLEELDEIDRRLHTLRLGDFDPVLATRKQTPVMATADNHRRDLSAILSSDCNRDAAMLSAWQSGNFTYTDIANALGIHRTTVSRIIKSQLIVRS